MGGRIFRIKKYYLKSCDRILEAQKIIILEKIEGDRIFRVIEDIEEIRYTFFASWLLLYTLFFLIFLTKIYVSFHNKHILLHGSKCEWCDVEPFLIKYHLCV